MTQADSVLAMAMLANGPYWHSAIEILTAPSGVSFYRSFNYRPAWVHDGVLGSIEEGASKDGINAIIGMRFRDDPANEQAQVDPGQVFIPLRNATVRVKRAGVLDVSIRLGDHIALDQGTSDFHTLVIPAAQRSKDGEPILLRWLSDAERMEATSWSRQKVPDHGLWSRLVNSELVTDAAKANFRDLVVLYAASVSEMKSGKDLVPEELGLAGMTRYGYKLRVGRNYSANLQVRRIGPAGQQAFPEAPDFELLNEGASLTSSVPRIPFTGNYRDVSVWIRPLSHQPVPLDAWWQPRERQQQGDAAPPRRPNVSLRIPFVAKRLLPWSTALLSAASLGGGAWSLASATGRATDTSTGAVLVAAGTLAVSLGVASLHRALDQWQKQ
jgi:hypothetical protein